MVADVNNHYTQSVSERNESNSSNSWESFAIQSIEGVQQHFSKEIDLIFGGFITWKQQSFILSWDKQLHMRA